MSWRRPGCARGTWRRGATYVGRAKSEERRAKSEERKEKSEERRAKREERRVMGRDAKTGDEKRREERANTLFLYYTLRVVLW
jgi:hypothetical protein